MSVWDTTTYKLDVAKAIYETIPFAIGEILGPKVGQYLSPEGELHDIQPDDDWETVSFDCDWGEGIPTDEMMTKYLFLTRNVKNWSVGVAAVYKLLAACYYDRFVVKDQYQYSRLDKLATTLGRILAPTSLATPEAFLKKWDQSTPELLELSRKFENFSEGWKYFGRTMLDEDMDWVYIEQGKFFGSGRRLYHGKYTKNLILMVGSGKYRDRGLVFTKTHINLIVEGSARISNLLDHTAREHFKNKALQDRIVSMLELTLNKGALTRKKNSDKVVQAFHKARAYMQMVLFSNVMENALNEAIDEYREKELHHILPLDEYIKLFSGIPKGRWLELLHVYKWMPPPDFDATSAFQELYQHHMNTRPSGLDPGASERMVELWSMVVKERKLNIALAYKKIHKVWPTGLELKNDSPTSEGLDRWEPEALFPYHAYGRDVSSQIKDKSTVLASFAREIMLDVTDFDRSFLLWYLKNKDNIDSVKAAKALAGGWLAEDGYSRVAYKGEAHKPNSRLFFMAPPLRRILLGELEGNISRIASCYPASLQGMDSIHKAEKLAELFSTKDDTFVEGVMEPYTCYIVTFDLSKFSPKFNPAVLKDLHKFWSRVFDYSPINAMSKIGADDIILHTTNRLIMQYQNKGADLEGYRGKMMTLFHADLIAAASRLAKKEGYILGKAVCAVFIDDGAVRIAAKGDGKEAKENALKFLRCMQEVYAAAGQENHPNKTIVSLSGGELLAEQYLNGQKLKCPIKAAMRLLPHYEGPANCITEEFDALFSTVQGSVKDGADWVIAYRRYCNAVLKSIARWDRTNIYRVQPIRFALRLVTPKSMGGFGFPSLQSLVTTGAYDMTSEGLGLLSYIARSIPIYQPYIDEILMRPVVIRDPLQALRDPTRIRMGKDVLIEGRLLNTLIDYLSARHGYWYKSIKFYKSEEIIEHARAVGRALLDQPSVSVPVMKRAWESTPLAYLESIVQKFERSSSILHLIPAAEIQKIRNRNRNDVVKLLTNPITKV